MYGGEIVESGPTAEVLADPRHPRTRALLEVASIGDWSRRTLGGDPGNAARGWPADARVPVRAPLPRRHRAVHCGAVGLPVTTTGRRAASASTVVASHPSADLRERPLLEVSDLRVTPPRRRKGSLGTGAALFGVDLQIHAGEIVGIVGETGSGKTTLARATVGLVQPAAGSITFDGREPRRPPRTGTARLSSQRPGAAGVPGPAALPRRRLHRRQRSSVSRSTSSATATGPSGGVASTRRSPWSASTPPTGTAIPPAVGRPAPARLPGPGHRQARGCSSATSRSVPSTSPTATWCYAFSTPPRLGLAVVIIAHDLSSLAGVADRVAVFYRGRLVEQGPIAEVLERPARSLHGAAHRLRTQRAAGRPAPPRPAAPRHRQQPRGAWDPAACVFAARCVRARRLRLPAGAASGAQRAPARPPGLAFRRLPRRRRLARPSRPAPRPSSRPAEGARLMTIELIGPPRPRRTASRPAPPAARRWTGLPRRRRPGARGVRLRPRPHRALVGQPGRLRHRRPGALADDLAEGPAGAPSRFLAPTSRPGRTRPSTPSTPAGWRCTSSPAATTRTSSATATSWTRRRGTPAPTTSAVVRQEWHGDAVRPRGPVLPGPAGVVLGAARHADPGVLRGASAEPSGWAGSTRTSTRSGASRSRASPSGSVRSAPRPRRTGGRPFQREHPADRRRDRGGRLGQGRGDPRAHQGPRGVRRRRSRTSTTASRRGPSGSSTPPPAATSTTSGCGPRSPR